MAQNNAAKDGAPRIGIAREHGHAQCRFHTFSHYKVAVGGDEFCLCREDCDRESQRKVSQLLYLVSFPLMTLKKVVCTSAVTGPGRPAPIWRLSTSRIGVTSAAVPVKKASSAVYSSSRVNRSS